MPQPNWIVNVGLAKEVGGWGVVVNPQTTFLSCAKPLFTSKQAPIYDKGLRGIRAETQGIQFGEGHEEIALPDMPFYGDDSGHLLMAMFGADAITGAAKNGTIGAVAAGATSVTYTPGAGGASVTGDIFKIDAGLPTQEIVIPTSVAANVWTVPATGPNSFRFAHGAGATAVSLFQHILSLLNTGNPASYTFAKYDGLVATARQSAGVYLEELTFKFVSPGALTVSAKGRGKLATNATKSPTPAWSVELFTVPWQGLFTLAGAATARFVDFELSLKAAVDQIFGMAATQSPTGAIVDQLTATGKFTVVPDDYTEFNYYLTNGQPSLLAAWDTGSTRLSLQMSKLAMLDPTVLEHSGNYSILTSTFEAIANATDAGVGNSPIKATLLNSKAVVY
jgi:hypothetical protein